jgi:hypothetical protein
LFSTLEADDSMLSFLNKIFEDKKMAFEKNVNFFNLNLKKKNIPQSLFFLNIFFFKFI